MKGVYKSFASIITIAFSLLILLGYTSVLAKSDPKASASELTFTVRTVTENGNYSPKHVLAIWVEDANGFVKTRKAMANQRIQYLYTWKASSNYNVVDAITGSTLTSHQTHTVSWDCTDLDGNVVPDGDYTVFVEFTEEHAQGPLFDITFTKDTETISMTPPDETYFKDLSLTFTPLVSDFTVDNDVVCQEETIAFIDQSVNANSWLWDFGVGAEPATANTVGPHMVYYTTSGTKTVDLTINGSLTETKEDFITVSVDPMPDFTFSGNEYTVYFANTSSNATSYLWEFGDGTTSTEENPVYTFASAGTFTVNLSATYMDCENAISYDISVPMTGIENKTVDKIVNIFPNPNNGSFALELPKGFVCEKINITDQSGRTIKEYEYLSPQSTDIIQIDLGDVEKGLYFIEMRADQSKLTQKFIVR